MYRWKGTQFLQLSAVEGEGAFALSY